MTVFLTSAQMRIIEQSAIDSGRVSGLELMARAGAGVVHAVLEHWPDMAHGSHRAIVLSGPGNNGGDGFVIASDLRARGWQVDVVFFGTAETLPEDARQMYRRWVSDDHVHVLSVPKPTAEESAHFCDLVHRCANPAAARSDRHPVLFVDALFGIGLSRPLCGWDNFILQVEAAHGETFRIVAVDVPSGLDADTGLYVTGEGAGTALGFRADVTVTFHALKRGHLEGIGPRVCGAVKLVDIGLSAWDTGTDEA